MIHVLELLALLLLLAVGHATVNAAPGLALRIVRSFSMWVLAFGVGIAILCVPIVALWAVRFGVVIVAAYIGRWLIDSAVDFFRGPYLLAMPSAAALGRVARGISGLPPHVCRKVARRICREHDNFVALMGLACVGPDPDWDEETFYAAWYESCQEALRTARDTARRFDGGSAQDRVRTADVRFVAQAFFLFEQKSVEGIFKNAKSRVLGNRFARARTAALLEKSATKSAAAERIGLRPPAAKKVARRPDGKRFSVVSLVWPALGIARGGFAARAAILTLDHICLIGYGVLALSLGRSSGWVFLAVAVLVHVEGAFALEDFSEAGECLEKGSVAAGGQHEQE